MGRTRDVSKILTSNTSILSLASASSIYQTKATAGFVFLNVTSFTTQSSISLNNVFSSTYTNYKIIVNLTDNSSNDGDILLKWRNSGTDSSSNYYTSYTGINTLASPGIINKVQDPATVGHAIGKMDNSTKNSQHIVIDVGNVFLSNFTRVVFSGFGSTDASNLFSYNGGGNHQVSQSYDGLTLISENGNITGSVSVYGYNK
jgi:hypothetical protein